MSAPQARARSAYPPAYYDDDRYYDDYRGQRSYSRDPYPPPARQSRQHDYPPRRHSQDPYYDHHRRGSDHHRSRSSAEDGRPLNRNGNPKKNNAVRRRLPTPPPDPRRKKASKEERMARKAKEAEAGFNWTPVVILAVIAGTSVFSFDKSMDKHKRISEEQQKREGELDQREDDMDDRDEAWAKGHRGRFHDDELERGRRSSRRDSF